MRYFFVGFDVLFLIGRTTKEFLFLKTVPVGIIVSRKIIIDFVSGFFVIVIFVLVIIIMHVYLEFNFRNVIVI